MVKTATDKAVALLVFDGRQGLPGPDEIESGQPYPEHTIVELPFQRELVRKLASSKNIHIDNEVIFELEGELNPEVLVAKMAASALATECKFVITAASDLLSQTGLSTELFAQLQRQGQEIIICVQ